MSGGLDPVSYSMGQSKSRANTDDKVGVSDSCGKKLQATPGKRCRHRGVWQLGALLRAVGPICSPGKQDDMVSEHILTPSSPRSYSCLTHTTTK